MSGMFIAGHWLGLTARVSGEVKQTVSAEKRRIYLPDLIIGAFI